MIPHPEQFWPILLAEYDVDGIEAWNPQSQEYTEFLINVVNLKNKTQLSGQRPILIFMGDDCHLSEKIKEPQNQNKEKVKREVGFQPAWGRSCHSQKSDCCKHGPAKTDRRISGAARISPLGKRKVP